MKIVNKANIWAMALRFMRIWSFERGAFGRGWCARASWGELSGCLGLGVGLQLHDRRFMLHVHLGWPNLYLRLPILNRWAREERDCMGERWGFALVDGNGVHLHWGTKTKIVRLPWAWEFYRRSFWLEDGEWAHDIHQKGKHMPWAERKVLDLWAYTYPYTYTLRSGEVQSRKATVTLEESECRQRWLLWTPLFARVRKSIQVKFDGEVGEGAGSWKGGTVGCSYDLLPGEAPEACLRRMERERRFNR